MDHRPPHLRKGQRPPASILDGRARRGRRAPGAPPTAQTIQRSIRITPADDQLVGSLVVYLNAHAPVVNVAQVN